MTQGRTTGSSERSGILTRRAAASMLLVPSAWWLGCRAREVGLGERVENSLAAGLRALIAAQGSDGSWRSPTYGVFRDGLTLTAPILKAVAFGPDLEGSGLARRRGAAFLAGRVRADGSIDDGPTGLVYPVYTASAAAIVLSRVDVAGGLRARDAWLRELRARQLAEPFGWEPTDPAYGAWGYAIEPPSKSQGGRSPDRSVDADLSSTLFAIGALRIAGATADDPAIRKALAFVRRCQNVPEEGTEGDPDCDDGGFFFTPTDPVRNKAGDMGQDRLGRVRYHSYGSATADGLRALLRCGLPVDHPRVVAARSWLECYFSPRTNPGIFEPSREADREATYYYYGWSVAHAFRAIGGRSTLWAGSLAAQLIRRQRADGTWANRYTASKEDDPLVATAFAVGALGICRTMIVG